MHHYTGEADPEGGFRELVIDYDHLRNRLLTSDLARDLTLASGAVCRITLRKDWILEEDNSNRVYDDDNPCDPAADLLSAPQSCF